MKIHLKYLWWRLYETNNGDGEMWEMEHAPKNCALINRVWLLSLILLWVNLESHTHRLSIPRSGFHKAYGEWYKRLLLRSISWKWNKGELALLTFSCTVAALTFNCLSVFSNNSHLARSSTGATKNKTQRSPPPF